MCDIVHQIDVLRGLQGNNRQDAENNAIALYELWTINNACCRRRRRRHYYHFLPISVVNTLACAV